MHTMMRWVACGAVAFAISGEAASAQGTDGTGRSPTLLESFQHPFNMARNYVINLFREEEKAVAGELTAFRDMMRSDAADFALLIQDSGYQLAEIDVGASLFPSVSLIFNFVRAITPQEKAALAKKLDAYTGVEGVIVRAVIDGLIETADSVYAVRGDGFELSGVQVDAALIPVFTLIFTPPG